MLLERFPAFPLRISATTPKYKIVFLIKFPTKPIGRNKILVCLPRNNLLN